MWQGWSFRQGTTLALTADSILSKLYKQDIKEVTADFCQDKVCLSEFPLYKNSFDI